MKSSLSQDLGQRLFHVRLLVPSYTIRQDSFELFSCLPIPKNPETLSLKPCRLPIVLFQGAVASFAGLFGVFYYIFLLKAPVKLPKLTICARKKSSNTPLTQKRPGMRTKRLFMNKTPQTKKGGSAQGLNNRTLISHEPLVCSKMCFSKTEPFQ